MNNFHNHEPRAPRQCPDAPPPARVQDLDRGPLLMSEINTDHACDG